MNHCRGRDAPLYIGAAMHSLTEQFLDKLAFTSRQAATLKALGEYRGRQALFTGQKPETLKALLTVAMVESTDSSNRIEGIVAPKARVKALVTHDTTPQNRSEQEITGYRDALEMIHRSTKDVRFSVHVLRMLHSAIYRYLPDEGGQWKTKNNEIVERGTDGEITRVRFRAVEATETPDAMDWLVTRYTDAIEDYPEQLVIIALTILDFLCIHPFRDGNGRVSRLITLTLLYHAGYDVGRYISLERLFEESRRSYYEALEACSVGWHDGKHDPTPWLDYFWGVLIRAYKEFEERVGEVEPGRGSKSERVRVAIERKIEPFPVAELERDCPGVSRETIRNVLKQLKEEGLVESRGRGPGARWLKIGDWEPVEA